MTIYRATADRNGRGWAVRVDGVNGGAQTFRTRDLGEIASKAQRLIWSYTGAEGSRIDLQVRLPDTVQARLDVVAGLCEEVEAEFDAVIVELIGMGVPLLDVARLLEPHRRWATRPLTITNAEVSRCGLEQHPNAVAVEWDDHGFGVTRLCRSHLDEVRATCRDLGPEGLVALVYAGWPVSCDYCGEGEG